jgi:uncharacterized membrane protein YphA (DoxX/SURF4 family)
MSASVSMIISELLQYPYLLTFSRWLLAAIFSASAIGKIQDRRAFVALVLDYQILSKRWARRFAVVLPWLEGATGLMLLIGLGTRIAAGLSGLLLVSFIFAMGLNLLRGRKDLDCGCSGAHHRQKISGRLILRNMILLFLSFQVTLWGSGYLALDGWLSNMDARALMSEVALPLALTDVGVFMLFRLFQQLTRLAQMEGKP